MQPEEEEASRYRRVMMSLAWLMHFDIAILLFSVPVLIAPIMHDLALTYTQAGLLLAVSSVGYIFLSLPSGTLLDRLGLKRTLFMAALLMFVGCLYRGLSATYSELLLASLFATMGTTLGNVGTPKIAEEWFHERRRGAAMGTFMTGFNLGSFWVLAFTPAVLYPLFGGWRPVFQAYAAYAGAVAVLWWLLSKERSGGSSKPPQRAELRGAGRMDILRSKNVWSLFAIILCVFGAQTGLAGWLPSILVLKGVPPSVAGLATGSIWLGGLASNAVIPRLSDRVGLRRVFIFALTPVYGLAVYGSGTEAGLLLWVAVFFVGISGSYLFSLLPTICIELPEVRRGTTGIALGFIFTGLGVGATLFPFVGGYLKDVTGSFDPGIITYALGAQLALIFTFLLRETGWRRGRGPSEKLR